MKNAWFYFYSPCVGSSVAINMKSFLNTLDSWRLRHCAVVMPQSTREILCLFSHRQLHIFISHRSESHTNCKIFAESVTRSTMHRKCDITRKYFIETDKRYNNNQIINDLTLFCLVFPLCLLSKTKKLHFEKWPLSTQVNAVVVYFFFVLNFPIRISLSIFVWCF